MLVMPYFNFACSPSEAWNLRGQDSSRRRLSRREATTQCKATGAGSASELIMDAELVACDREDGNRLRAFQDLTTRARGAITLSEVRLEGLRAAAVVLLVTELMLLAQQSAHIVGELLYLSIILYLA